MFRDFRRDPVFQVASFLLSHTRLLVMLPRDSVARRVGRRKPHRARAKQVQDVSECRR